MTSMEAFGPVALDYYTGRRVLEVQDGQGGEGARDVLDLSGSGKLCGPTTDARPCISSVSSLWTSDIVKLLSAVAMIGRTSASRDRSKAQSPSAAT